MPCAASFTSPFLSIVNALSAAVPKKTSGSVYRFDGLHDVRYRRVAMSLSAYPSPSLVDRIAEQVTTQIFDGALRAGDSVNIDALARAAQVSSVPVREALARLSATGLLVFTPNRGYSVAPLLTPEQRASNRAARCSKRAPLSRLRPCLSSSRATNLLS
jgi:DNA-binding transcriptional regulator YhcF (GntR family)